MEVDVKDNWEPIKLIFSACLESEIQQKLLFNILIHKV